MTVRTDWQRVLLREWKRLRSGGELTWMILWLPPILMVVVVAVFHRGRLEDLPLGAVNKSNGTLSRELIRRVEALPSLTVLSLPDEAAAQAAVRRGEIYGYLVIPSDLEGRIARRESAAVHAFLNGQMLVVANALETDLTLVVQSLSKEIQAGYEVGKGRVGSVAAARVSPILLQRTSMGNPGLDYLPFLAGTAVPCLLHVVVLLTSIWVVGVEFRDGSALRWWRLSGRRTGVALIGKLLPVIALGCLWGWCWLAWLHATWLPETWGMRWPVEGSPLLLAVGWMALVGTASGLGAGLVVLTANLRLSLSSAAFLSAPAMAFVGVTFPHFAMPSFAFAWAHGIPVTHFMKLQEMLTYKGGSSADPWLGFLLISVIGWMLALCLLPTRCTLPRYWGKR